MVTDDTVAIPLSPLIKCTLPGGGSAEGISGIGVPLVVLLIKKRPATFQWRAIHRALSLSRNKASTRRIPLRLGESLIILLA